MSIVAYKFQSPNGSYWYIRADDERTIDYWKDKRKLIPLTDDDARIAAGGAVVELLTLETPAGTVLLKTPWRLPT